MNKERFKRFMSRFAAGIVLPIGVNGLLCLFFYLWEMYHMADPSEWAVVDAFQVSGMLTALFGCILLVSSLGAFDFLIFGIRKFLNLLFPVNSRLPKTYKDYVADKNDKRTTYFLWPWLAVGIVFIIIGTIIRFCK